MPKFDLKNFDKTKHYALEASAGTGKTYNIVEILKMLVDPASADPVSLDKILLVTYTEKAVGELKDRIRKELKGVDTLNANIFTIHSFCQNAIKELGITAQLPLQLDLTDNLELEKFAKRFIRQGAILSDISKYQPDVEKIIKVLIEGVGKYYLDSSGNEVPAIVVNEDKGALKNLLSDTYFQIRTAILNASSFADLCAAVPEIKTNYDVLKSSFVQKANEFADEIALKWKDNFNYNGTKFRATNKDLTSKQDILDAFTFFRELKEALKTNYTDLLSRAMGANYLSEFYIAWQAEKELHKSQTYDDMLRYVRETIIANPAFKKKLQDKFSIGIIDEFQDTNQKQFDIFKAIFMEDKNHRLIVVGDPKQSIYAFQGSDVSVYQKAVSEIGAAGGNVRNLSTNWRSTAAMVEACNGMFSTDAFWGNAFVPSNPLTVSGKGMEHLAKYDGNPCPAFWIAGNKEPVDPYDFADIAVQQIIDCCSRDANGRTRLQLNRDKKNTDWKQVNASKTDVSFKDFAVLAKTGTEMIPVMNTLKKAGIPYIRYKDPTLFSGRECAQWIALFDALSSTDFTGYNRSKFRKVLFTDFFGHSLKNINDEDFNTDSNTEMQTLLEWKQLCADKLWDKLIDRILLSSELTVNRKGLKDIQTLAIHKQIAEYCLDLLSNGSSPERLVIHLSDLIKGAGSSESDENGSIVAKSTDFDCVKIMTIHASKGLEFPVVICVGGFKDERQNHLKYYYSYHSGPNSDAKLAFHVTGINETQIAAEVLSEWKSLYYVAYTRAQYVLMLPRYDAGSKPIAKQFLGEALDEYISNYSVNIRFIKDNGQNAAALQTESQKILAAAVTAAAGGSKAAQNAVNQELIKSKSAQSTFKKSYSSLSHDKTPAQPAPAIDPDDETVDKEGEIVEGLSAFDKNAKQIDCQYDAALPSIEFPAGYPRGAALGTALHEIFEHTQFTNYEEKLEALIEERFAANKLHLKPEWMDVTKAVVDSVLNAKLPVINGCHATGETIQLKNIPEKDLKKEPEFNFNVFGGSLSNYLNGFIDLLFRNGQYFSIVDWKSDVLNDNFESYADAAQLRKQVNSRYSIQRVLYAYCLIKWLKSCYKGLSEQEIFEHHFGGVYYVFLRGCSKDSGNGIYCQTWNSWAELEAAYKEVMHK